jgi:hypothetical protein
VHEHVVDEDHKPEYMKELSSLDGVGIICIIFCEMFLQLVFCWLQQMAGRNEISIVCMNSLHSAVHMQTNTQTSIPYRIFPPLLLSFCIAILNRSFRMFETGRGFKSFRLALLADDPVLLRTLSFGPDGRTEFPNFTGDPPTLACMSPKYFPPYCNVYLWTSWAQTDRKKNKKKGKNTKNLQVKPKRHMWGVFHTSCIGFSCLHIV